MKEKSIRYKSARDFAKSLGLSNIEIELALEKKRIIEKLKAKRKRLKLSQATVAHMIESQQPTIARMESGQVSEVSLDFLAKIAMVLGVSFSIRSGKVA